MNFRPNSKAAGKYGLMIRYTGSFTNWLALKECSKTWN